MPVVTSIAVRKGGTAELLRLTDEIAAQAPAPVARKHLAAARRVANCAPRSARPTASSPRRQPAGAARHLDRRGSTPCVLHPVAGLLILALILFVMFQAVFAWAQPLMELLSSSFDALGAAGA